jgi:hypothetical protein
MNRNIHGTVVGIHVNNDGVLPSLGAGVVGYVVDGAKNDNGAGSQMSDSPGFVSVQQESQMLRLKRKC